MRQKITMPLYVTGPMQGSFQIAELNLIITVDQVEGSTSDDWDVAAIEAFDLDRRDYRPLARNSWLWDIAVTYITKTLLAEFNGDWLEWLAENGDLYAAAEIADPHHDVRMRDKERL